MPTPHIESREGEIAKVVLMPGDPKRAQFIAEHFLKDAVLVNDVRGMKAYTGMYQDTKVTVFASGMGIPSMGIYAYELYHFYDVDTIVRIGSCGSYEKELNLYDLILVDQAVTDSNFSESFANNKTDIVSSDASLNQLILETASSYQQKITKGAIFCSEAFYHIADQTPWQIEKYHCLGVEMESFALFTVAKALGKKASCILTVSDSLVTKEETTSEEREKSFTAMMKLALETVSRIK